MIDCSVDRTLEKSCHGSACFRAVFLHVYQEIRFVVDLILYSNMWLGVTAQCLEVTDYTVYVFPLNLDICQPYLSGTLRSPCVSSSVSSVDYDD